MAEKREVIVRLMGGLGNQMLQFATGYALAKEKKAILSLDINYYKIDQRLDNTHREYELSVFALQYPLYSGFLSNYIANKFIHKLDFLRNKLLPLTGIRYFTDRDKLNEARVSARAGKWYLDGYWTSFPYFDDYREELCKVFDFEPALDESNRLLIKKMERENSVAIHVRRTDYLLPVSSHYVLSRTYYTRAIEFLQSKVPDAVFYFFGDDHAWIKENFPIDNNRFFLVDQNVGQYSYMDMALMTKSRHVIISNSTFSWWGAYLNQSQGVVMAPDRWFLPGRSPYFIYENFILKDWVRIEAL
jgi:hypothetical protein